jgi:hypothetical protein
LDSINPTIKCTVGGYTEIYAQTKNTVTLTGGENIDMTGITPDGDTVYTDMISYYVTQDIEFNSGTTVEKSDGDVYITIYSGDDKQVTITCSLPEEQNIILPVEFMDEYQGTLTVSSSGGQTSIIGVSDDGLIEPINKGVYYCSFNGAKGITFVYDNGETEVTSVRFKLGKLFPYYYTDPLDKEDKNVCELEIHGVINNLDTNNIFDYTYQPNDDVIIKNPLSPKSYFSKHHHCNEFTIPQISEIKIKTMNKRS